MYFIDLVSLSVSNLSRNKSRTFLTMLGIVIGVMSVILMLSIGQAAEQYILNQVSSFGSDLVIIRSGPGDGGTGAGPPTMTTKQVLTLKDYQALKKSKWVKNIGGTISSDYLVEHQNDSLIKRVSGVTEDEIIIFDMQLQQGRFINADDLNNSNRVVVLGAQVADDFFSESNPLGQKIKIQKNSYRVIGVMEKAGTRFFTNLDNQVYIPLTSLMRDFNKDRIMFLMIKISPKISIIEAKDRVRDLLRDRHNIDNPNNELEKDDFYVATQDDAAEKVGVIGTILQILLSSMAAISLIVGGVGIMNIMFVSVTERTREIGLRKAIGAQKKDILQQFLFEATIITLFGGIVGVLLGLGIGYVGILILQKTNSSEWSYTVPWLGVLLGLGVSSLIGLVFGFYPAKKASNLNAIEALRYE